MLLFYTCAVVFAFISGNSLSYGQLLTNRADAVLVLICIFCTIPVAAVVGYLTYRLGPKKGLFAFAAIAFLSVIGVISALSMQTEPLNEMPLRGLHVNHVVYVVLLFLPSVAPLSSFFGWYGSTEDHRIN